MKTHIKFNQIQRKSDIEFRPEIVGKRNDSRVNRHQQIQLQGWRANCDIQLIIIELVLNIWRSTRPKVKKCQV